MERKLDLLKLDSLFILVIEYKSLNPFHSHIHPLTSQPHCPEPPHRTLFHITPIRLYLNSIINHPQKIPTINSQTCSVSSSLDREGELGIGEVAIGWGEHSGQIPQNSQLSSQKQYRLLRFNKEIQQPSGVHSPTQRPRWNWPEVDNLA